MKSGSRDTRLDPGLFPHQAWFQHLDINATSVKNLLSHACVVGKCIRHFTALSKSSGYWEHTFSP